MKRRASIWALLVLLCLCPLALVALLGQARAENTTTSFKLQGLHGLKLSVVGATNADVVATPTGRGSKVAQIVRLQAGGQKMFVLIRVEQAAGGLFIDGIAAATTTALATEIDGFDITGVNHPHPTNDAVDDAAATAMVGYADP